MIHLSAFADEISADPAEQVATLAEHGIRHIEFRSIFGTNVLDLSPEQHQAFAGLLLSRGFALSAIGSPIGKIPITDPFEPHLDRFAIALDLAAFYNCPRIRIFSYYMPKGGDPETYREEVMRRMARKAEIAAERGVTLMLENEKGIYGDTAARVAEILATVNSPGLAHAFDPANYLEVGQPVEEAWALLRPWVKHFHVKDYDPSIHKNVVPGTGGGRIPELLADAFSRGYGGFAVLEPHLVVAEASYGFTGPERFGEAATALRAALAARGVAFG
jgi:sugar phosphate isomerase/epimerase